jgi:hypothetical protein
VTLVVLTVPASALVAQGSIVVTHGVSKPIPADTRKVVVIGKATVTLARGARKTIHVKLNSSGKQLLAGRQKLAVQLSVKVGGRTVFTQICTSRPRRQAHIEPSLRGIRTRTPGRYGGLSSRT